MLSNIFRRRLPSVLFPRWSFSGKKTGDGEPNFLEMVESYFDKAAAHTKIPLDRLNLYKKSECVIKFHLTLKRGTLQQLIRRRHARNHSCLSLPTQNSQDA